MDGKVIKVGMSDLNVAKTPDTLTTLGLGSCVGIALYDSRRKIAGLAHAMLPSSEEIENNKNKAKFVDTSIDELIIEMKKIGASNIGITAKIAGGSQMFKFNSNSDVLRIGERNVIAAKEKLKKLNIRVIAEDTGGNFGRTIIFDPKDGSLHIRTIGHGEKTV